MNWLFNPRLHRSPDGGGGNGSGTEQEALLKKINENVNTELEKRGYQNKDSIEKLIGSAMEGLNLEQLRAFDAEKVNTSLRNIAGELEKVKNIRIGTELQSQDFLQEAVRAWLNPEEGKENEVEMLMRSKGKNGIKEVSLNIRAAVNLTTANAVDQNNYPLEMVESLSVVDAVVKKRRGTQFVFDLATRNVVDEIEQYTTWLEEGNEQGAYAIVAEGAVKPLVSTSLVRNYAKAKKVAGKTVITEEFVKWRKKAWAAIQDLLNDKILRDYAAILTADLQAQAASYAGTTLDGTFTAPNDFDAIGAVAAQIETLNFFPDLLIIHPQDKWRLILEKDTQGRYFLMVPVVDPDGVVRMLGFRVLTSTYQTPGTFTLGEAGLFKIEEEALTIRLGYGIDVTTATVSGTSVVTGVKSDFDSNQMRMIIETFFKDWIATNHLGSFVTASFATVKTALLKAA